MNADSSELRSISPSLGAADRIAAFRESGLTRPIATRRSAFRTRARDFAVGAAGVGLRVVYPLLQKWRSLWWATLLRAQAREVGSRVHLYGPVHFLGSRRVALGCSGNLYGDVTFETADDGQISIGNNFRINRGTLLSALKRITIGDNCLIGEYVSIRDCNHVFEDPSRPIGEQGFRATPIAVGHDVWIARGVVILRGVTIGDGAVIAANSVVTRDVPSKEVWAGVPARFLKHRGKSVDPH